MKIENQVCTLEQAKKLKELGIEQIGNYSWLYDTANELYQLSDRSVEEIQFLAKLPSSKNAKWEERENKGWFSAFTVGELAAFFGKGTIEAERLRDSVDFEMNRSHSFTIAYSPIFLANCLIHLLETNSLTAEEANKRLSQ